MIAIVIADLAPDITIAHAIVTAVLAIVVEITEEGTVIATSGVAGRGYSLFQCSLWQFFGIFGIILKKLKEC